MIKFQKPFYDESCGQTATRKKYVEQHGKHIGNNR